MYPQPELIRGSARKAAVRRAIVLHRSQCSEAAVLAVRPLELVERVIGLWRRLAPFAGIAVLAVGLRRRRSATARPGALRTLLRWATVLLGTLRLVRAVGRCGGNCRETAASPARHL